MFLWQKRAQVEQQIWTFVKYTGRALPVLLMVSITQLQSLFVKIHVICAGKICVLSWWRALVIMSCLGWGAKSI
jgi:hypothetical protein